MCSDFLGWSSIRIGRANPWYAAFSAALIAACGAAERNVQEGDDGSGGAATTSGGATTGGTTSGGAAAGGARAGGATAGGAFTGGAGGSAGDAGGGASGASGGAADTGGAGQAGAPAAGETGTGGEPGTGGVGGAGGDGGVGGGASTPECTPTEARCQGRSVEKCSSAGQWEVNEVCADPKPICVQGACQSRPSCEGLGRCGANEYCCASPLVTGGNFYRGYDGVTTGYIDSSFPATVSSFRLDTFEITVGRFRKFVGAWNAGWRPQAGSGKHEHLNQGRGLALAGGGFESGWNPEWINSASWQYAGIPSTPAEWDTHLSGSTWTSSAPSGANEDLPLSMASWFEFYAFCIWDGGFLPTEAEWNYAASAGAEQRVYPWGTTAPGTTLANFACNATGTTSCGSEAVMSVGKFPAGQSKFGQKDLAGNLKEWVLDYRRESYFTPCSDCVVPCQNCSSADEGRVIQGGSFYDFAPSLLSSARDQSPPRYASVRTGARCARVP